MAEILAMKRSEPNGPLWSERSNGILRLTLANPPANALSLELMEALQAELDAAASDKGLRVIVIAGHGGKVFSGGHDLKQMQAHRNNADKGSGYFERSFAACSALMQSIVRHPLPVIAEVEGIATAAGCQLVATCDLAIASDQSRFGVNGIDVGLFCTTPGVALARSLQPKHALEMLLTGEMIDASTAREFGLVNRIVPKEYVTQVVNKYAQTIAAKSPTAVRLGKKAFYEQAALPLAEAYAHASRVMVENMLAHDAIEGVDAFIGKRQPVWNDEQG